MRRRYDFTDDFRESFRDRDGYRSDRGRLGGGSHHPDNIRVEMCLVRVMKLVIADTANSIRVARLIHWAAVAARGVDAQIFPQYCRLIGICTMLDDIGDWSNRDGVINEVFRFMDDVGITNPRPAPPPKADPEPSSDLPFP